MYESIKNQIALEGVIFWEILCWDIARGIYKDWRGIQSNSIYELRGILKRIPSIFLLEIL